MKIRIFHRLIVLYLVSFTAILYAGACGGGGGSTIPQNLRVDEQSTELLVSWDGVDGASSYNVYWSTSPDVSAQTGTKIEGVAETTYLHTGLKNGTTYYYIVAGVSGGAEGVPSDVANGTPVFEGEEDFEISIPWSAPWGEKNMRMMSDSAGYIYLLAEGNDGLVRIYKYNSDGGLETSFGDGGSITHGIGIDGCFVISFVLNAREELVVGATCGCDVGDDQCDLGDNRFARTYRYLSSGALDTSFGGSGYVDGDAGYYVYKITTDADNNVFITGKTTGVGTIHMFAGKYSDSGAPVWLFDDAGLEDGSKGQSIIIGPDGSVIIGHDNGLEQPGDDKYIIWKLNSDGTLMSGFGSSGRVVPAGYQTGGLITVGADGRFVTNVNTQTMPLNDGAQADLLRYDATGALDSSFGGAGRVALDSVCVTGKPISKTLLATEEYGGKFIASGVTADAFSEGGVENLKSFVCIMDENGVLDTAMFDNGFYYGPDNSFALSVVIDPLGRALVGYQVLDPLTYMITELKILRYR